MIMKSIDEWFFTKPQTELGYALGMLMRPVRNWTHRIEDFIFSFEHFFTKKINTLMLLSNDIMKIDNLYPN